jgi:hypothetical protein
MSTFRQVTALAIFFGVIGLAGIIGGTNLAINTRQFVANAVSVPGVVVRLEPTSSPRNGNAYYSVFKFTDEAGQTHECRTTFASNPPPYETGNNITVLYQPSHPESACIQCFSQLWLWPTILLSFGVCFMLAGTAAFIGGKKTYGND